MDYTEESCESYKKIYTVCPHCGRQEFLEPDENLTNLLVSNNIQQPVRYPCEACKVAHHEQYVFKKETAFQKIFMKMVWIAIALLPVGIYLGFFGEFWDDTTNLLVFAGCWAAVPVMIIIGLATKRFVLSNSHPTNVLSNYYGNPFFSEDPWNIWHKDK